MKTEREKRLVRTARYFIHHLPDHLKPKRGSSLQPYMDALEAALAQSGEGRVPDAMLNVELPVRVVVGNNMGITAGCKLRTLLLALARRGMPEWMPDLDRAIRNEYGTAASEPNKGNSDE